MCAQYVHGASLFISLVWISPGGQQTGYILYALKTSTPYNRCLARAGAPRTPPTPLCGGSDARAAVGWPTCVVSVVCGRAVVMSTMCYTQCMWVVVALRGVHACCVGLHGPEHTHTPRRGAAANHYHVRVQKRRCILYVSRASHFPARLRTWGQRLPIHLIMNNE